MDPPRKAEEKNLIETFSCQLLRQAMPIDFDLSFFHHWYLDLLSLALVSSGIGPLVSLLLHLPMA
jgi:hypothetical protein